MAKKDKDEEAISDDAGSEALERLSAQVDKAVGLIRELRSERVDLEQKINELQARVDELETAAGRADELEKQQSTLEGEKAEIRRRIESILEKFEELENDE